MKIRIQPRNRKPHPLASLGERCPALIALRDRLASQVIVSDDLPASYIRLLYGMSDDQPVWSRSDAVRQEGD